MKKIGFIGLGTMGAHFATNLIKAGAEITVHDIRRDNADTHLSAGAKWADTPRELAAGSELIMTSLPGPTEVEAVALDETDGLIAGMAPGTVLFDLSTNSPTMVRHIHTVFAARDLHCLDAPVSGGPKGAASGKLAIWVGGDEAVFSANRTPWTSWAIRSAISVQSVPALWPSSCTTLPVMPFKPPWRKYFPPASRPASNLWHCLRQFAKASEDGNELLTACQNII